MRVDDAAFLLLTHVSGLRVVFEEFPLHGAPSFGGRKEGVSKSHDATGRHVLNIADTVVGEVLLRLEFCIPREQHVHH